VRPEYRWLDFFERVFHVLVLPPSIVLLLAIFRRVDEHGLTERRYLLAILALWLIGLSLFQLVTRSRNIKLVPSSLALLALLTFGGPWSAYAVSRWEQRDRLEALLRGAAMLDGGGRAKRPATPLSYETRRALSGTVTYLLEAHGDEALSPWLDAAAARREPALALRKGADVEPLARRVLDDVGVEYVDRWTARTPSGLAVLNRFAAPDAEPLDVSSYRWALRFSLAGLSAATFRLPDEDATWTLEHAAPQPLLRLRRDATTVAEISLVPLLERLEAESVGRLDPATARAELSVPFESERARGVVAFDQLYGAIEGESLRLDQATGELFFTLDSPR
jgi:hypothetical protein